MSTDRETSIRRGVDVLLALGSEEAIARGGLGVTRMSEVLGREKSQVSRTLKTLAEYGLVDRDAHTLAYRLGWRIYALAQLAGERRLLDEARPLLARLVDSLEERAYVTVLQGDEILTVLSESPLHVLQAVAWVGRSSPAYCTSAGRALLLDHSRDDVVRLFAGVEFRPLAANTPRDVDELLERIEEARTAGYAIADEEFEPGLIAVAAPVRGVDGRILAALNISGPKFRCDGRVDEAAAELAAAAAALSSALGAPDTVGAGKSD